MARFPKKSVWAMLGLAIITFELYLAFWFWTRRAAFNSLHSGWKISPIPVLLLLTAIIAHLFSYVYILIIIIVRPIFIPDVTLTYLLIISYYLAPILGGLIELVMAFKMRKMLTDHYQINLSILATFFFRFLYIQYKINRLPYLRHSESGAHTN